MKSCHRKTPLCILLRLPMGDAHSSDIGKYALNRGSSYVLSDKVLSGSPKLLGLVLIWWLEPVLACGFWGGPPEFRKGVDALVQKEITHDDSHGCAAQMLKPMTNTTYSDS